MNKISQTTQQALSVQIPVEGVRLEGNLTLPDEAKGVVLFAHGSGSSRFSPRNRFVAQTLNEGGLATLLVDLLTPEEEALDQYTRQLRFDIGLLANRLIGISDWLQTNPATQAFKVGCFGSSTGAAAGLITAVERPELVKAVVSRGGRPDLASPALERVKTPTLLIVGGYDTRVINLNLQALKALPGEKRLEIIPGATHLFEEPGALEKVAHLARQWFHDHFG